MNETRLVFNICSKLVALYQSQSCAAFPSQRKANPMLLETYVPEFLPHRWRLYLLFSLLKIVTSEQSKAA